MLLSLLRRFPLWKQESRSSGQGSRFLILPLITLFSLLAVKPAYAAFDDRMQRATEMVDAKQRTLLVDVIAVGERLLAVGERGRVLISTDQGASWQQGQVPVSVMLTAIATAGDSVLWGVGHDGIVIKSSDAGDSWSKVLEGGQITQLVADYYKALVAEAEADPNYDEYQLEELVFRAEDAAIALEDNVLPTLLNVRFSDADNGYLLGAYGLLMATRDGGQSWQVMNEALGNVDGFHLNDISFTEDSTIIAGEGGILFRSRDSGASWEALYSPYDGSFFGIEHLGNNQLIAYGLRGNAFESADDGDSWQQISLPLNRTLTGMAQLADGTQILVGSFGAMLVKSAGADAFKPQPLTIPAPSMAVVPVSNNEVVVVGLVGAQRVTVNVESTQAQAAN